MENFNYQEYRNNLAKDLKEIRKTDPEEARSVLEEEKQTTEYKEAENVITENRKQDQINFRIIEEEYRKEDLLKNYSNLLKKYNSLFEKVKNIERRRMDPNDLEINYKIKDADEERHNTHLKLLELGKDLNKTREDVLFDIIRQKTTLEEIGLPEFSILQHDDIIDTGYWHNRYSFNLDRKNPSVVLPPLEPGKWTESLHFDEEVLNEKKETRGPLIPEDKCILLFTASTFKNLGLTEVCPNDFLVRKERAVKLAKEINEKLIDLFDSGYHEVSAHIIGVTLPKKDLEKVANIIIKNPQKFRLGYEFYSDSEKADIKKVEKEKVRELMNEEYKNIKSLDQLFEKLKTPEELLEYMDKNIEYGYVSKDNNKIYPYSDADFNSHFEEYFLQTPEELLSSKQGVCWDQVELERSWFSKNEYESKAYFLMFAKEELSNLPTHTFLAYKKDDKFYWFENSFGGQEDIHEYKDLDTLIEDVKVKLFDVAKNNYGATEDDFKDIKICEYGLPEFGCNPSEFINNILDNNSENKINKE